MRLTRPIAAIVLLASVLLPAAAPVLAQEQGNAHSSNAAYWTRERIAHAIPRDFVRTPAGRFVPEKGKPGGGGGSSTNVIGASWTGGGQIVETSGKVLFTMAGVDYICSGAVINDDRDDYSIVLTAGHCSYDETNGAFATKWTFYPNFDANATYGCEESIHGCWDATALVVHDGFASAGGFTDVATHYDWSFGVVGAGGNDGLQLDDVAGSFAYSFVSPFAGTQIFDFGYPAAGKYHGYDLIYCSDQVFFDSMNGNNTLGIDCNMTGGSSGGPWLTDFNATTGVGVLRSVNSYSYTTIKNKEYGPKFNANTSATYGAASTATSGNVIVGQ